MTSSLKSLPPVDVSTKDPSLAGRTLMPNRGERPAPLLEVAVPPNGAPRRTLGAVGGAGQQPPSTRAGPRTRQHGKLSGSELDVSAPVNQSSLSAYSPTFDRSDTGVDLVPLQPTGAAAALRTPILSATDEGQRSATHHLSSGSPLLPRRLGGLLRSHNKEARHKSSGSVPRNRTHSATRTESATRASVSGLQGSQELTTCSFSAVQVSPGSQSLGARRRGSLPAGSDPLLSSVSSPLVAAVAGSRHNRGRSGSELGQMPMVSIDVNALNTSCSEDTLNTSRTLRGARAVLRRKQLGSFRLGTSRTTPGSGMNGSLARRNSLNNRTISFVGGEDALDSSAASEGLLAPIDSPRQRTRVPGGASSSTVSTGRVPSAASGGLDHSNSIPIMERVNTDSAFLFHADDDSASHSRRGERGRQHGAGRRASATRRHGSAVSLSSASSDDAEAALHDRKVQTLIMHLSRSGINNVSRPPQGATLIDVPGMGPPDEMSGGAGDDGGSQRFTSAAGERSPLNGSDSASFPVMGGGWSGLGGGDVSAVTSNDWYARMRMKVSQESDEQDSVRHLQPTPSPELATDTPATQRNSGSALAVKPAPPPQLNVSPSPKAKLERDKALPAVPPTPAAHTRRTSATAMPTDVPRSRISSIDSNRVHTAGNVPGVPVTLLMTNMASSQASSGHGSPLARSSKRGSMPTSLSGDGDPGVPQPQPQQHRLSHAVGGTVHPLSTATSTTAQTADPPPPAVASPLRTAATATSAAPTHTAPARAVYRRSAPRPHPSDSMPLMRTTADESYAAVAQQMTPLHSAAAAAAKRANTERRLPSKEPAAARVTGYVRPVSGVSAASARSPFKAAANVVTAPTTRDSELATSSSAATPKPLEGRLVPGEQLTQPHSSNATPSRGAASKPGGYMPVRRQSLQKASPSTGAETTANTTARTSIPSAVKGTILADTKTPQAPTTRRTTVRRRSSQPLNTSAKLHGTATADAVI